MKSKSSIVKRVEDLFDTDDALLKSSLLKIVDDEETSRGKSTLEYSTGAVQWGVRGKAFIATGKTQAKLPAGWYKMTFFGDMGYVPELLDVRTDELLKLPIPEYGFVLDDIRRFWDSDEKYRKFNFPYKRGILLYGQPGTGKSGLLRLIADDLIKRDGVVFNIGSPDDIYAFESVFTVFRELEPSRQAICVMEDVDNFARYGGSTYAKLLNILDGNMRYDGVVFLATTNYPDVLLDSLSNRPSRFDRRYEIGTPSKEAREVYVSTKFPNLSKGDVDNVVSQTENFTIDGLKEVVVSVYVLGYKLEDVIQEMQRLFVYRGKIGENVVQKKMSDSAVFGYRDDLDNQLKR